MADLESAVLFEEDPESDSIDDFDPELIRQAVVYASDWTTETLLSQFDRGNIKIDPKFQRRDAWTRPRKSRFIESLILGLPVPQIVLAEKKNTKGQYLVLDGKQRLLTLLQFTGRIKGENCNFLLGGLDVRKDLHRKGFADLNENMILHEDLNAFLNQTVRAVVIRNWPNEDFLHLVFVRLNTGSVSLSPQELRAALFPGPFVDFSDKYAAESEALQHLLKNTEPDFRMRDVEILTRFIGFRLFLPEYRGSLKHFLDRTCEKLNSSWERNEEIVVQAASSFEMAVETGRDVFGEDNVGRKWVDGSFESRLNRAVLDVQTFYFSNAAISEGARAKRREVVEAFMQVSEAPEFRDAVERTTKSITATFTRLHTWGVALRDVLNVDFEVPRLEEDRILFNGFKA